MRERDNACSGQDDLLMFHIAFFQSLLDDSQKFLKVFKIVFGRRDIFRVCGLRATLVGL